MPANREVLSGIRSTAKRVVLDAPQDELALTFDDAADLTFDDLAANEGPTPATRTSLTSETSAAVREVLSS